MPHKDESLPCGYEVGDTVDFGSFRERLAKTYGEIEVVVTDARPDSLVPARAERIPAEGPGSLVLLLTLLLCAVSGLAGLAFGFLWATLHRRLR